MGDVWIGRGPVGVFMRCDNRPSDSWERCGVVYRPWSGGKGMMRVRSGSGKRKRACNLFETLLNLVVFTEDMRDESVKYRRGAMFYDLGNA